MANLEVKKKNNKEEIFIRELKSKEKANPTRHITEEQFSKKEGYIIVYKPYGNQGKGYYYVKGNNSWENKKENSMEMTTKQEYKFSREGSNTLLQRGLHNYGTKVDNSVCECPECYGGGRLGLFACRNCKGSGKIENKRKVDPCPDCDGQGTTDGEKECKSCNGTGMSMSS